MLEALGVDNYGINAVVGGIVAMSSIVTISMSVAISRYITFTLGRGDENYLRVMFSTAVNAQIIMSLLAVIILEICGLWFLNTIANIPIGRMHAANWVFQCSLINLVLGLIGAPYNSLIIAHERMSIYAYVSIVDVIFRLAICYVILCFKGDRLILLAILQVLVSLGTFIFYRWYCGTNFKSAKYCIKLFDKNLIKDLTKFSGWNLLNNSTWILATTGINLLVNVYFGVVFNASRAIATTVNSSVQSFVRNFTVSFTPQITKNYASGKVDEAILLTTRGAKFTWLMTYVFIVPIFMSANELLELWLGEVPPYASLFLRFTLFESLTAISSNQLFQLILADGHLKKVNIQNAIFTGLIFPLVWISYKVGFPVWSSYIICIIFFFFLNFIFLYNLKDLINLNIKIYISNSLKPCLIVSIASFVIPALASQFFHPGIVRFIIISLISIIWTLYCCYKFGLSMQERIFFTNKLKSIFSRLNGITDNC
ncbi:MAG: hypothetical protein NC102_05040 [Clostridium sp.]|nr:hypothetical protein [Clostridium sp.]